MPKREYPAVAIRIRTGREDWQQLLEGAVMDAIDKLQLPLEKPQRSTAKRNYPPPKFTDVYLAYTPAKETPNA